MSRWWLIGVLAGCFSPAPATGIPCTGGAPCPEGQACIAGVCGGSDPTADAHPDQSTTSDSDGDGLVDADDNCPAMTNADQADEDDDGIGDVCDVCPMYADAGQEDTDDDGVGDPCDPEPTNPREHWVTFEGFNAAAPSGWSIPSGWTIANGKLASPTNPTSQGDATFGTSIANAFVIAQATVTAVDPGTMLFHSLGPITAVVGTAEYRCLLRDTIIPGSTNGGISRDATPITMTPITGAVLDSSTVFRMLDDGTAIDCDGELDDGRSWMSSTTDSAHGAGVAGVRVQQVTATFDYVAIIKLD